MLDRGQHEDWFDSAEIWIEAGVFVAACWMFVIHTVTAKKPLFERSMFADRNFALGLMFMMVTGVLLLAGLALLPPLLQQPLRLFGASVGHHDRAARRRDADLDAASPAGWSARSISDPGRGSAWG